MPRSTVPLDPPSTMDAQPPRLTFGRYVRHLRESRGWTQEQVQERSGLGVGTISRIENDETNRTQETTEKLARAFDQTEADLLSGYQAFALGRTEPPPAQPPMRRTSDMGLDPVVVLLVQRLMKLPGFARHAVEGVIDAFEDAQEWKETKLK